MKKRLLFLSAIFTVLTLSYGDPRHQLPETPSQVWQNDLDLRDMINSRISLNGAKYCIDNPTFCVDADNDEVEIGNANATFSYDSTNFEVDVGTSVNISGDLTVDSTTLYVDSENNRVAIGTTTAGALVDVENSSNANVFQVTDDGYVTQPIQPSFLANLNSSSANVTGDNTIYTVVGAEIFDLGSNYNASTGVFTAPVSGYYKFGLGTVLQECNTGDGHTAGQLTLVTSNASYVAQQSILTASDGQYGLTLAILVPMDANDTASMTIQVNGGAKTVDAKGSTGARPTWFSGSLVN